MTIRAEEPIPEGWTLERTRPRVLTPTDAAEASAAGWVVQIATGNVLTTPLTIAPQTPAMVIRQRIQAFRRERQFFHTLLMRASHD